MLRGLAMNVNSVILLVFALTPINLSYDCNAFNYVWKNTCPQSFTKELWCYESVNGGQVLDIEKDQFTMKCNFQEADGRAIPCIPISKLSTLIMTNCQFSNFDFKRIAHDREPKTVILEYKKDTKVNLDIRFANLKRLQNIFISNVTTDETFPAMFGKDVGTVNNLAIKGHTFKTFTKSFSNFGFLQSLTIQRGPLKVLKQTTLEGTSHSLVNLDLSWNLISQIEPATFKNFFALNNLILSGNKIMELDAGVFSGLTSLNSLKIDMNKIMFIENKLFSALKAMRSLNISHNPLTIIPKEESFGPSPNISVSAQYCNLHRFPAINWKENIRLTIDLSHNLITHPVLPVCGRAWVTAKLHSNNISTITLNQTCSPSYNLPHFFLANNTPVCDCELRPFLRYFLKKPRVSMIVFPDFDLLRCRKLNISLGEADTFCPEKDCPSICTCDGKFANCSGKNVSDPPSSVPENATWVVLSKNKLSSLKEAKIKYWNHVTHINVSQNLLVSLDDWEVPDELKMLDVRHNHLSHLPSDFMYKVEDSSYFEMYLSNNEWRCDCQLVFFKDWFMANSYKVKDFEDTFCKLRIAGGSVVNALIKDAYVDNFCSAMRVNSRILVVILPIIMVSIIVFAYYYKFTVFSVLYSWNLLPFSYSNEPMQDKRYDAFICANVADRPIVIEMIRKLEPQHRLCIPERDWPKDSQFGTSYHVNQSLRNSRSTVLIISKDSLQEIWFQVKVRGAYNQRLEDDVHKMILIVVGNISDVPTKHDIREIIASEPCMQWGERWIWQKLRYELRHPEETVS